MQLTEMVTGWLYIIVTLWVVRLFVSGISNIFWSGASCSFLGYYNASARHVLRRSDRAASAAAGYSLCSGLGVSGHGSYPSRYWNMSPCCFDHFEVVNKSSGSMLNSDNKGKCAKEAA